MDGKKGWGVDRAARCSVHSFLASPLGNTAPAKYLCKQTAIPGSRKKQRACRRFLLKHARKPQFRWGAPRVINDVAGRSAKPLCFQRSHRWQCLKHALIDAVSVRCPGVLNGFAVLSAEPYSSFFTIAYRGPRLKLF